MPKLRWPRWPDLDQWDPEWRNGPRTPRDQIVREAELLWNTMLTFGLQPGQDTECAVHFSVAGPEEAERVAAALPPHGLRDVEIDRDRSRFLRRVRWSVSGYLVIPGITLEQVQVASLRYFDLAEELGCRASPLFPHPPDAD